MQSSTKQHIFVTGACGAGTSTLAKALSHQWQLPLHRLDDDPGCRQMLPYEPGRSLKACDRRLTHSGISLGEKSCQVVRANLAAKASEKKRIPDMSGRSTMSQPHMGEVSDQAPQWKV